MNDQPANPPGAINTARGVPIDVAVSEEGQRVAWDGWAWQRRELTKVLPPATPWPSDEELPGVLARHGLAGSVAAAPIAVPAQICADVYLAGSWPNHTYVIDCGQAGIAVIDPGLIGNHAAIADNITALGLPGRAVRWVLNTHGHFDHSMSDALFRAQGAEICAGAADADAIERGTRATANYLLPDIAVDYPTTTVDRQLTDGDILEFGTKQLQVIATPGHTPGSVCFALQSAEQRVLFSGDTVLHDQRLGWQGGQDADDVAYLRSLDKLAQFGEPTRTASHWDVLLPGHGTLAVDDGRRDVQKARHAVRRHLSERTPIPALPFTDLDYRRRMFGRPRSPRTMPA